MDNQLVTTAKRDIKALLQSDTVKSQLALALPKWLTADRMARVACTAVIKSPKLLDCKPESLLQAVMLCAQAGLEPDGRSAHLIPYGDQVQVIFDYKGLVALAERNGVECIYADRVCENDEFEAIVVDGEKKLTHKVDWKKPRGAAYAYYTSCRRNGRLDYEVMTKEEVDAVRKRSKASGSGPWVTDYDEMAKKTTIRRMSKRWDLSPETREAMNADDDVPDFRHKVEVSPAQFIGIPAKVEAEEKQKFDTIQTELEVFSVQQCKTYFDAFATIVKEAAAYESFADMPNELCETLLKDKKALKLRLGVV